MKFYKPLTDKHSFTVQWNHWEHGECVDGNIRKKLVVKRASISELLDEFVHDIEEPVKRKTFAMHDFVASWQTIQYLKLKDNLPEKSALLILDFGKNKSCETSG